MNRKWITTIGLFLSAALLSQVGAAFAASDSTQSTVRVSITVPPGDGFELWINQALPVNAIINDTARPINQHECTIAWSATDGSFTDPYSAHTTFIAPDYADTSLQEIILIASAQKNCQTVSSARVSTKGHSSAFVDSGTFMLAFSPSAPIIGVAAPAIAPLTASTNQAGDTTERGAEIEKLRHALALQPDDPNNIVLEFKIAIALSQHADPVHNQFPHPMDAVPYLQHIVEHYDHKAYYRTDNASAGSDSPDMLIPRAAILLAELTSDDAKAGEYIDTAMQDLDWTFRTRTHDWESAAKPTASPFVDDRRLADHIAIWEKSKADAAAGKAVGPYDKVLAEAAVRVLLGRHQTDTRAALQSVVNRFPISPLATAALAQAMSLGLSLDPPAATIFAPQTAPAIALPTVTPATVTPLRPSDQSRVLAWSFLAAVGAVIVGYFVFRIRKSAG